MNNHDVETIVEHMLSVTPFFNRKFMLTGESVSLKHMPLSHIQVLLLVNELGRLTVSDIGSRLSISRPNMTPLLNKLIEEGYVERQYSEKDRRVIWIILTEKGEIFIQKHKQLIAEKLKEQILTLSESELETLTISLRNIKSIFSKLYPEL
ncbi:MarR family transcriptional regulator [Bacillus sp. 165]|uniref:MarR family winged helix-turn-helix transcriptional regulator n=1 Tax=Bacillus sp. 165 TaxID=1529117 RepID=UPI001ADABB95|nr:MarR family transcriptional regulator [Bacillus sp. 165]MBO9129767.1 MarR family transcriptional regulator [Bacillus sp. 165]